MWHIITILILLILFYSYKNEGFDSRVKFYAVTSEVGRKPNYYPYLSSYDSWQYIN